MFVNRTLVAALACRILPIDILWPIREIWDAFNISIDGRLIKAIPIGSPCHDPTYDAAQCNTIRQNWHVPDFQFVVELPVRSFRVTS
jgi:hypothetical protein